VLVARYFADWHGWSTQAESLILALNVDEQQLAVDEMSLLDPIPLAQRTMGILDMDVYLNELARHSGNTWISELAKKHGIDNQQEWEVSLRLAHTAKHLEIIDVDRVVEILPVRKHGITNESLSIQV
jgi:hypothetical protein